MLKGALDGFEVLPGKLIGEAEERLFLNADVSAKQSQAEVMLRIGNVYSKKQNLEEGIEANKKSTYKQQMGIRIEFCGGKVVGHG